MLDILHGSGAVVEPAGVDQDQSSNHIDLVRDDIFENITKEFKRAVIDMLKTQHDHIKYIKHIE